MTNDVIPMPPDPHGLGVATAWPVQSTVSLGSHAAGQLDKVLESVNQQGVTGEFQQALVTNATGNRVDDIVYQLTDVQQGQVDAAVTAVNRAHGISLEAQNVLNTKGGVAAKTAEMEAAFAALQAEFASKTTVTPQDQAEYERRYQELKTKYSTEIQSLKTNGDAASEAIIPQIQQGSKPSVPKSMNPNVDGAPSIPTMPEGLFGQALQMVNGVMKAPSSLPIPKFEQFAQPATQLTQAMITEMAKQAKDGGKGTGLEATGPGGIPVSQAGLGVLASAQKELDQKPTLSKPDGKEHDGKGKDSGAGAGRGAGAGAKPSAAAGAPAAPSPDSGGGAQQVGADGKPESGAQVQSKPEVTVPNQPGVSEVKPADSSGGGGQQPPAGAPAPPAGAPYPPPAGTEPGGGGQPGGGGSQGGGNTTLSSSTNVGDSGATLSPSSGGETTLSASQAAGGATTLSAGDQGAGAAPTTSGPAGGGMPAGGMGMAPMMGGMGGMAGHAGGAGIGGREPILDPSVQKNGGAHRRRVSVAVTGVTGEPRRGEMAAGLADSGADLVGLDHATPQQYQAASVVASLVRSHCRAGVLTEVAAGVCEDGRVVFATSDGLGFVTPCVRVPMGSVPLISFVPVDFVGSWLGCGQPWRALQAAERAGFVDRLVAVASSDPESGPSGVLAVSEEQMQAMNLPPAFTAWNELDGQRIPEGEVAELVERLAVLWDPPAGVSAARLESAVWSSRWTGEIDRGYGPMWAAYLITAARIDLDRDDVVSARYFAASALRIPSLVAAK